MRENRTLEYEEGWVTKYAEEGNNQGETEVNLRIEGKDERPIIDIVMLIDNSNSMKESDDYSEGLTRAQIAQKAAFEFIDAFSGEGFENVGIAAVVYGSTVFDGRTDLTVQRRQMNVPYVGRPKSVHAYLDSYRGSTKNLSVKTFQYTEEEKEMVKSKIPADTPVERSNYGRNRFEKGMGATFTQKAIEEADKIFEEDMMRNPDKNSKKFVVLITDGMPTYALEGTAARPAESGEMINYPLEDYEQERFIGEREGNGVYDGFGYVDYVITEFSENVIGVGDMYHLGPNTYDRNFRRIHVTQDDFYYPLNQVHFNEINNNGVYKNYYSTIGMFMVDSDKDRIKDITVTGPNNETRIAQIKDLGVLTASAAINLRKEYDLDIYALGVGFETDFVGGHESLAAKSRYVRLPYNDNYLRMEARNLML